MPTPPSPALVPDDPTPLTADEIAARDRIVGEALVAKLAFKRHRLEYARHLRELLDFRLYRGEDGHTTWETFVRSTFGHSADKAFKLIRMARVVETCPDLFSGGDVVEGQARVLTPLSPEQQTEVVRRGRALAEAEETALAARHLASARAELAREAAHAAPPERAAVRAHEGLLVVVPHSTDGEVIATLPAGRVVPYEDTIVLPETAARATDAASFARVELDQITDITWPVVAPDPWTPATTWTLGATPGVFFPQRLSSPRRRAPREATEREKTVIVAPGVDVLALPERVARLIVEAAGADPARRYVLLTCSPERAWEEWPANVYIALGAASTAASVAAAAESVSAAPRPRALVVHNLAVAAGADALAAFDWVLVRGKSTTQEAYDSLRASVPAGRLDRGAEVRARHSAYPPLSAAPAPERGAVEPPRPPRLPSSTSTAHSRS